MQAAINRILSDVRKGNNIALYVTIAIAIVLALLNPFGILNIYDIPILLAVLAVLTYAIVGTRHDLEALGKKIKGQDNKPLFVTEFPSDLAKRLEQADEIWFAGTHLEPEITSYHSLLAKKIMNGTKLRFLLVCPKGSAHVMAAKRFPGPLKEEREKIRILTSLEILTKLKETAPSNMEIKTIDFPIDFTAYYCDPNSHSSAIMYIQRATYKISGGAIKPKFVYQHDDGEWFDHFDAEFRQMWEDSKSWPETQ